MISELPEETAALQRKAEGKHFDSSIVAAAIIRDYTPDNDKGVALTFKIAAWKTELVRLACYYHDFYFEKDNMLRPGPKGNVVYRNYYYVVHRCGDRFFHMLNKAANYIRLDIGKYARTMVYTDIMERMRERLGIYDASIDKARTAAALNGKTLTSVQEFKDYMHRKDANILKMAKRAEGAGDQEYWYDL